jgi:hypothetical protein
LRRQHPLAISFGERVLTGVSGSVVLSQMTV